MRLCLVYLNRDANVNIGVGYIGSVLFQHSYEFDFFDMAYINLQDIISNNLIMTISGFEYYFLTSDITPTFDNMSEYGFASITLVKKNSIKKIRRACCN